jgi:hypothetical protein
MGPTALLPLPKEGVLSRYSWNMCSYKNDIKNVNPYELLPFIEK